MQMLVGDGSRGKVRQNMPLHDNSRAKQKQAVNYFVDSDFFDS